MLNLKIKYLIFFYNKGRNNKKYFCKAPYSSLFFDYRGNVFPCCANKHIVLGKFEKQSIIEIWNNLPMKNLRKSIEKYEFNYGCNICKNKLLQRNYSQVYARRYDYLSISNNNFPSSIEVHLFNHCNLDCVMCVVNKDDDSSIDFIAFKNYIKEIIPHLKNASFSGGEPFLIKEYFDIWEEIYKLNKNCIISVNTNAAILNKEVKDIINKLKFNISVSIDGFSKETFESIRRNSNRDEVYFNTLFFKDYTQKANTFFNVKICAIKQNIYEFPDLFNYFNELDVPIVINEVVYPLNTALWNNKPKKLKEIIEYLKSKTPIFKIKANSYHNYNTWNELLKMLNKYYKDALKFEKFVNDNKMFTDKIKEKVYKRLKPAFLNDGELNKFITIVENFAKTDKNLKVLYFFFLIAPFDRMIGEIEIRNYKELQKIFENIFEYFEWT